MSQESIDKGIVALSFQQLQLISKSESLVQSAPEGWRSAVDNSKIQEIMNKLILLDDATLLELSESEDVNTNVTLRAALIAVLKGKFTTTL
ncbi:MAG: hypothetical protein RLZZ76_105 [Candidatus Parcubacteria bacterium]|jgi:hypothetical protein